MSVRIYCDALVSHAHEIFGQLGQVEFIDGRTVTQQELSNADILITRSTTRVDNTLLNTTPVRFVGSTTIGIDHVDLDYLKQRGIAFAHAPGCNAVAVAEYVASTLAQINAHRGRGKTAGIIGYGNVGQQVAAMLSKLQFQCVVNDPPRQNAGLSADFPYGSLSQVLQSDVICLHVPLTANGRWPTYHLLNAESLAHVKPNAILLNAGRGDVIDNGALVDTTKDKALRLILDVWEGEPEAQTQAILTSLRASPHIAGHSLEGKLRGTFMVAQQLADFLAQPLTHRMDDFLPAVTAGGAIGLADAVPLEKEDRALRFLARTAEERGLSTIDREDFDALRRGYELRREFDYLNLEFDI